MTDIFSCEKAPQAVSAVRRLLTQHSADAIEATPLGGCNALAFRVDAGAETYFVRVLPEEGEWDEFNMKTVGVCVASTTSCGEAGVTAAVLAADEGAVIQAWRDGKRVSDFSQTEQFDAAERIGEMISAIHSVPLCAATELPAPHSFYRHDIKADRRCDDIAMTECWEYLESVDRLNGIGGELVLSHGDLHNKNVLVQPDGSLLAVDLELAGQARRAFDLAFWNYHWEMFGTCTAYPPLSIRCRIARSYLQAATNHVCESDLDDLMFAVEFEVLRVALLRINHSDVDMDKKAAYKLQLPVACELLKQAQGGDEVIRSAIIQKGILPFSLEHVAACTEVIEFSLPTMLHLPTPQSPVHAPLVAAIC